MTATCEQCEPKLSDDEIQDAYKIDALHLVDDCVGCAMVMMKPSDEVLQ